MSELMTLIQNFGFPTALAIYLLLTRDNIIKKNTEAINKLSELITQINLNGKRPN